MRIKKLDLSQVEFTYTSYSSTLYDSIMRIGFSFPIKVEYKEGHYLCVDGHKRLSVLTDILNENQNYKRGSSFAIIIKNSDDIHTNDCSRGRNTH